MLFIAEGTNWTAWLLAGKKAYFLFYVAAFVISRLFEVLVCD